MANEFKIKKGLIVTGASGGTVVDIQGSQGQLFSVTDDLSGSIFAVSDISGVPILDVNSSGLSTFDGNVNLPDNKKILLGTGNDLELYHDGTNSFITNSAGDFTIETTGDDLILKSADDFLAYVKGGEIAIQAIADGKVGLRYNNVEKLATTSTGVAVTGGLTTTDDITISNTSPELYLTNTNALKYNWMVAAQENVDQAFEITPSTAVGGSTYNAPAFKILGTTSNATFAAQAFSAATSSGDASSTLTTKGYVDGLITGATIYRGAWDPSGGGYGSPDLSGVTQTSGYYYICSADGTAEPNGTGTEPDTWAVGDWVIYNDVSGTGQWQKIDNSSVLSGVGTGQTVALWEGAGSVTDSETLGNAPITVSGNNATFAGTIYASGNNSVDWSTAYQEARQWDGGNTNLTASTGRVSLGATTIGDNMFTLANPGAITFPRFNADNTISPLAAAPFRNAIGAAAYTALANYLPLAGGTMTGNIDFNDSVRARFGDGDDLQIVHDGSNSYIHNVDVGDLYIRQTADNKSIILQSDDGSGGTATYLTLNGNSTDAYFSNPGNVGIGTTSPQTALHTIGEIVGGTTGFATGMIGFTGLGSYNSSTAVENIDALYLRKAGTDGSSTSIALASASGDQYFVGSRIKFIRTGSNSKGHLAFETKGDTSINTTSERMRITDAGNVGIGTTTPLAKLDIQGTQGQLFSVTDDLSGSIFAVADISGVPIFDVNSSGVSYFDGNVGIGTDDPTSKLHVFGGSANTELKVTTNDNYIARLGLYEEKPGNLHGGFIQYRGESGDRLEIGSRNAGTDTVHMSIDDITGNVGIGTDSPEMLLDVGLQGSAGAGDFKKVMVNVNGGYSTDATFQYKVLGYTGTTRNATDIFTQTTGEAAKNFYTGMVGAQYFNNNRWSIIQGGVERLTVEGYGSNVGNVGIGTDSPSEKLTVSGGSSSYMTTIENTTAGGDYLQMIGDAGSPVFQFDSGGTGGEAYFSMYKDNVKKILLDANVGVSYINAGNVGIGTTNPGAKLHVIGSGENGGIIFNNSGAQEHRLYTSTNSQFNAIGSGTPTWHWAQYTGVGVSPNYKMTLNNTGLGIGTTSPDAKLEINSGGGVHISDDAAGRTLIIKPSLSGAVHEFTSDNTAAGYSFSNNSSELMRIAADGNVGIGTTSPTQAKLCVSGATFQTGDLLLAEQNTYSPEIKMTNSTHTIGIDYQNNETLRFITRSGATTVPITFQMRAGTITAANFILSSDERKKTKVKDLSRDSISVNWKSFEMKENEGEYRAGVIAQELEIKHPEFVNTDDEGFKSVKYIDLLIAKIAELEARLEKAGI